MFAFEKLDVGRDETICACVQSHEYTTEPHNLLNPTGDCVQYTNCNMTYREAKIFPVLCI